MPAWTADSIRKADWFFNLTPKAIEEILELSEFLDRNPIAVEALQPEEFELPACRELFNSISYNISLFTSSIITKAAVP